MRNDYVNHLVVYSSVSEYKITVGEKDIKGGWCWALVIERRHEEEEEEEEVEVEKEDPGAGAAAAAVVVVARTTMKMARGTEEDWC